MPFISIHWYAYFLEFLGLKGRRLIAKEVWKFQSYSELFRWRYSNFTSQEMFFLGREEWSLAWGNYISGSAWTCTQDKSFKVWSSKASQAKYLGWTEKFFLDQIVNRAPATSQKGTRLFHCKQSVRVTREVNLATRGISYSGHMSNSPIGVQSHFED